MNGYADTDLPVALSSDDISALFAKPAGWFADHRVRRRLYARGFPHPIERGRWSPLAVREWMAHAGSNTESTTPRAPRPRRRNSRNGYVNA
jgi:hypothetical protein